MKLALRRHATTLTLVLLAASAAVVVLVVDRDVVTTDEAEGRKRNLLEAWRPADISELTLTAGGKTAILRRSPPDSIGQKPWTVTLDGRTHPADEQMVDQLLGTLEFATAERRVSADAADPSALGLGTPRVIVELVMGARRERITLGGSAPTPQGAMYAEVAGRGTFVVTKQLATALDLDIERLRSRSIVPYLSTQLSGLRLEGEGGTRRFTKAPWGGTRGDGFRFDGTTPEGTARVRAEAIDRTLIALGKMQADVFLSSDEATASAKPRVTLTLLPRDAADAPAIIELGGDCPRTKLTPSTPRAAQPPGEDSAAPSGNDDPASSLVVAVRREPTIAAACVPASVLEALTRPVDDYVDLWPIAAPIDEIVEMTWAGAQTLDLAREDAGWHQRAPEDRRVSSDAGRALAQSLVDVQAARIIPAGDARGLESPRATLKVISTPPAFGQQTPGERIETLDIGAPVGEFVHVRRAEDGVILEIPRAEAEALVPSELAVRPLKIFSFRTSQIRSLRLEVGGRVQRLQRTTTGAWDLVEPSAEGLVADIGLATDVAELLAGLSAQRWVSADAGNGYGLARPRAIITAEIQQDAEGGNSDAARQTREIRVELGAPATSGAYARTGESPAVFVAPASLETAASRLLLSRAVFMPPLDRIRQITLTPERGTPTVVTAGPGGLRLTSGPLHEGAEATMLAAGVRDALNGLLAEEAVSLGAPTAAQGLDKPRLRVEIALSPGDVPEGPLRFTLGAGDVIRGTTVYYARREGIPATYVIAQSRVRPLLEAAGIR
ncbi:DUF4340 domain-containing protein [Chondromyces crocatus]|uniref:DUF4340 domain-containing protein n=1 Tax=Chondromyces crocatus TaxID=52 RepID=A0A0K1EFU8_CHOCO|nr:DUF4340 domain-containing protein [Chondromyces crocatus]AKT39746.1 uncharacterized protein CMC5_038970 [Chondromyces crocatus]